MAISRKSRTSGNKCWLFALVLSLLASPAGIMAAGAALNPAGARSALYRAETYAVLLKHRWRIVSDQPDKLVAEQPCATTKSLAGPGIYLVDLARLTIEFTPQSITHTKCDALIVGFAHGTVVRQDAAGNHLPLERLVDPIPLDSAEYKKEIQNVMAEAEKRLTAAHPEYAAH